MTDNRKDCPMRHENGNCLAAGGFCTSVNDPICEALHNAYESGYRASKSGNKIMSERQKPLTIDELRKMAGEPVWCADYQCYGVVKLDSVGVWKNFPFLVGVWHDNGFSTNFEHDIKGRGLTLYRNKPKE